MQVKSEQTQEWWLLLYGANDGRGEFLESRQRIEAGPHPTDCMLYDYVLEWLPQHQARIVGGHLLFCRYCAEKIQQIREVEQELGRQLVAWTESPDDIQPVPLAVEEPHLASPALEYWEPELAGKLATASANALQEHLFKKEDGDIKISCYWRSQYHERPAYIKLLWHANLKVRSELRARFINPDTQEVRSELVLGTQLIGEEAFTSQELGFDPSVENWAVAIVLQETKE